MTVGGTVELAAAGLVKAEVPRRPAGRTGRRGGRRPASEPNGPSPTRPPKASSHRQRRVAGRWVRWRGRQVAMLDGGFSGYRARIQAGTELPADRRRPDPLRRSERWGLPTAPPSRRSCTTWLPRPTCASSASRTTSTSSSAGHACQRRQRGERLVRVHPARPGRRQRGPHRRPQWPRAARSGVLYVAAAGNSQGRSTGTRTPPATPPATTVDDFVNMPGDDALAFGVPAGGQASVSLQWDAWPTTAPGLRPVSSGRTASGVVGGSAGDQDGNDHRPIECRRSSSNNCRGVDKTFFVLIDR